MGVERLVSDSDNLLIFRKRGLQAAADRKAAAASGRQWSDELPAPEMELDLPPPKPSAAIQGPSQQQEHADSVSWQSTGSAAATYGSAQAGNAAGDISYSTEAVGQQPGEAAAKLSRSAKDSIKAAKGMSCTNHPWRGAYAICNYCKRPFCYADLMAYSGNLYCLEDIDYVSGSRSTSDYSKNAFSYAAAAIFIANALVLGYFNYPNIIFLAGDLQAIGASFLHTLIIEYTYSVINITVMAFGLISGLAIVASKKKGMILASGMGFLSLVATSYQYMNTGIIYLLISTGILFIGIVSLLISRISAEVISTEEQITPNDIAWPRPEIF
jgi:hypothetical protein